MRCCPWQPASSHNYLGLTLHFWMALVGSFIYVISLSVGGTIQGLNWIHGAALHSVGDGYAVVLGLARRRRPLMLLSHVVFAWNVWCMTYGVGAKASQDASGSTEGAGA